MNDLNKYLFALENLDLIGPVMRETATPEYTFSHIFTQESVYNSLLRSDRRQLHYQVGEALEHTLSAPPDAEKSLALAHHFQQAEDHDRAIKYLKIAASYAKQGYANREAKTLYRRALTLLHPTSYIDRWGVMLQLEHILDRLGERDQQADLLVQMQTLAQLLGDDERLAITHNRRAFYFDKISEYQAAAEAAEVGLRVARRSGNQQLQAESLNLLALAAWRRFDYRQVQKWAEAALEALRTVGDPNVRVTSLFHLGKASYRLGQYDVALRYTRAAQELTESIGNRDGEAVSQLVLGWIYQRLGEYDQAEQHFRAKLKVRSALGDRYGQATALSHLGWLAADQHRPVDGLELCRQALTMSQSVNDRENEAYALSGLALNHEQLNQLESAAASFQAALDIHTEIGASTLAIFDRAGLARIALATGQLDAAYSAIQPVTAWVLAGNAQKFWDPWSIYLSVYHVLTSLGDIDTARTILTEAYTVLHQRAAEISDDDLRTCFLQRVEANRLLAQSWAELQETRDRSA